MNEEYIITLIDHLDHPEDAEKERDVRQLIASGHISEEDLAYYRATYYRSTQFSQPSPSDRLRSRVYNMIREEQATRPPYLSSWVGFLHGWVQQISLTQLAGATLLLFAGVCLGFWLRPTQAYEAQLSTLTGEMQRMREMMVLTLLEQPSATQRLKAVSISTELSYTDETIYQALLKTLNYDSQVNVRLAALDALLDYADQPGVRRGLIEAIEHQDSPLVQITLAEVMVQLQEKRSVEELRSLLKKQELNEAAEQEIKKSIKQLI